MDEITGYVENIVFANKENGFTVAKIKENNKKEFTHVIGSMPSIQPGENLLCEGEWTNHPQYGKQFIVKKHTIKAPANAHGIQKYLESGLVSGVGPVYAEKIVDKFGIDTLEIIDKTPMRLLEIEGIGKLKNIIGTPNKEN
jgi:exodeoxyribonuclease V alpha subunit